MPTTISGSNGVTTPTGAVYNGIQSGTSVNTTSGTSVVISTSIPSWAKRVTVIFNSVSGSGTSQFQLQLGAGSFTTSGYVSTASYGSAGVSTSTITSGHLVAANGTATSSYSGHCVFTNISGNIWVGSGVLTSATSTAFTISSSNVTLGGALDRIRITTVNGTDTFDAGSINILYE